MLGKLRERYERAMRPIGRKVARSHLSANAITSISLLVACLAAIAYSTESPVLGGFGLLVSGFVDMLDGAVARVTRTATRFGAVYDHVLDRYGEFAVLLGIGIGGLVNWIWVLFCLFGMVMASYVRAKAESVGGLRSCKVGLAERQEKLVLLLVGSFIQPFSPMALTVCIVLVGLISHVTVVQRLHFTFEKAGNVKAGL